MKLPEKALVCALADEPFAVAGASFHHRCHRCGRRVMMAPTGQAALSQDPELVVLCIPCAKALTKLTGEKFAFQLPASRKEVLRELRTTGPNPWRTRN